MIGGFGRRAAGLAIAVALSGCAGAGERRETSSCSVREVLYNGWPCLELSNGRIDVVVAPRLGGRIVQLRLDGFEHLWVNRELEGVVAGGTLEGKWANYGGDKLWPAPQGWSGPGEWPGPPDPIALGGATDSGGFEATVLETGPESAAVRLVGPFDRYAGIRFVREVRIESGSTSVRLVSLMTNASDRPVRWGIWQVTQHDARPGGAGAADAPLESDLVAWVPLSRQSAFDRGFRTMFGADPNPQFAVEESDGARTFVLRYAHQVGKAALDPRSGWLAVGHERSRRLFVHTFDPQPWADHPDGASVELWASGPGHIVLGTKPVELTDAEPWLIESEVLSPFTALAPGETYGFASAIHLARAGGPVLGIEGDIAVLEPVRSDSEGRLSGRIAVFRDGFLCQVGFAKALAAGSDGQELARFLVGPAVRAGEEVQLGATFGSLPGRRVTWLQLLPKLGVPGKVPVSAAPAGASETGSGQEAE